MRTTFQIFVQDSEKHGNTGKRPRHKDKAVHNSPEQGSRISCRAGSHRTSIIRYVHSNGCEISQRISAGRISVGTSTYTPLYHCDIACIVRSMMKTHDTRTRNESVAAKSVRYVWALSSGDYLLSLLHVEHARKMFSMNIQTGRAQAVTATSNYVHLREEKCKRIEH